MSLIRWRHHASMPITLTLDDDVHELIDDVVHREHRSRKQVINEALRRALTSTATRSETYRLIPHQSVVNPRFDFAGFNRLTDELEDDLIHSKARHKS